MSALFDKIKLQLKDALPLVCYCKPNSDRIIALFQKTDFLYELDDATAGFAFVSFDNKHRYLIPENQSDVCVESVSFSDFVYPNDQKFEENQNDKSHFEALVQKAVSEIEKGSFEKVVLSRNEKVSVSNFDVALVFNKLIANYPTAFKYCFYHPKVGFWVGASPEQFLKIENNTLQTIALAGTQLSASIENVVWKNKEIEEQQIVADFIVQNLKKFSKNVSVSKPYTFQAGALIHIRTDIQAQIEDRSMVKEIIDSLHPTPAVCGFPKDAAKEFILNNEGYEREFYAGYLGEWNKNFLSYTEGISDLFVNLRCMKLVQHDQAELFVGCGINSGSIPELEYIETVNKSQTIKKVI